MEPETLLDAGVAMDDDTDPVAALGQLLDGLAKQLTREERLDVLERCASLLANAPLGAVDLFAGPIRHKLGFTKDTLVQKVEQVRAGSRVPGDPTTATFDPSPEDIERGKECLRDPRITERFICDMSRLGVVGEVLNLLLLLLTIVSRLLRRPISIVFKGPSGVGKSFLPNVVLGTLPRDQYVLFTAASAKALYFRTDSLKHKVLAFMERPGAEGSDYQVRVLQSEGQLIYSVAEKDPSTGQIVTVDKTIEGPVAYIETTTQATLHDENETRLFSASLDESQEATQAIIHEQARRAAAPFETAPESIIQVWQVAHSLLQPADVLIPYAESLAHAFPSRLVRARRDFPRFLALIESSALLHQYQRKRDAQGAIIATLDDYALARRLAGPLLETAIHRATPKTRQLIEAARALAEAENPARPASVKVTATKLSKCLPSSGWSKSTIRRHLKAADEAGHLDLVVAKHGEDYEYQLAQRDEGNPWFLPTREELEAGPIEGVQQPRQGASSADDAPNQPAVKQIAEVRQPIQGGQGDAPRLDFQDDTTPRFRDPDL